MDSRDANQLARKDFKLLDVKLTYCSSEPPINVSFPITNDAVTLMLVPQLLLWGRWLKHSLDTTVTSTACESSNRCRIVWLYQSRVTELKR